MVFLWVYFHRMMNTSLSGLGKEYSVKTQEAAPGCSSRPARENEENQSQGIPTLICRQTQPFTVWSALEASDGCQP